MTIDPKWRFIIGLLVTLAIGVSQGAVQLAHAIPADWIPIAVAWAGIIAFTGSAAQTGISALGMTVPAVNRLRHHPLRWLSKPPRQSNGDSRNAIAAIPEVIKVAAPAPVAAAATRRSKGRA